MKMYEIRINRSADADARISTFAGAVNFISQEIGIDINKDRHNKNIKIDFIGEHTMVITDLYSNIEYELLEVEA